MAMSGHSTKRHCIVSEHYSGLNAPNEAGIWAAGLAGLILANGGHADVIIADMRLCSQTMSLDRVDVKPSSFIFLYEIVRKYRDLKFGEDICATEKSFYIYKFIKDKNYSVVHFNDWLGLGFYSTRARQTGLLHAPVVTSLLGSSGWRRKLNRNMPEMSDIEREAIEYAQINGSDAVVAASGEMLRHCAAQDCLGEGEQLFWPLPQWFSEPASAAGRSFPPGRRLGRVTELVYCGLQERWQGFDQFIEAVALLPKDVQPDLTIFGCFGKIGEEFSGSYVFRCLRQYGGSIRFHSGADWKDVLTYLSARTEALCVLSSPAGGRIFMMEECLASGAPFVATGVEDEAGLIAEESRPHCVAAPHPKALAEKIAHICREGAPPVYPSLTPQQIIQSWVELHASLGEVSQVENGGNGLEYRPLVTICMTHYERPHMLRRAFECLLKQTYENIEIVITDDGSQSPAAHAYLDDLERAKHRFPVRIVRSVNKYLGAARNTSASHANGEYLLFHDDDNFAEPHEIEVFVKAAVYSQLDILTCLPRHFREDAAGVPESKWQEYFPIGIGGAFSYFHNKYGDANALIKKKVFTELGGFSELRGVGFEDWELFLKADLRGYKIGIVPEVLFNYRTSPQGMLESGDPVLNHERIFTMVASEKPRMDADLLRYAHKSDIRHGSIRRFKQTARKVPAYKLHNKLRRAAPNSPEARRLLAALALFYGRFLDALQIWRG